jgi:hypothetical protein
MRGYLSGPMTGLRDFNYPAFRAAAAQLRREGFDVIDPSENFAGDSTRPRAVYMRQDLRHVIGPLDCLWLLPGWEHSRGARLEVAIAVELGVPIFDFETRRLLTIRINISVGALLCPTN